MTGFIHLNDANAWSKFDRGAAIAIGSDGALELARPAGEYLRAGAFKAGPFTIGTESVPWFRLRAVTDDLGEDEHVELFTLTSDTPPPAVTLTSAVPFVDPWHAAPRNATDLLIPGIRKTAEDRVFPGAPARQLWVGGVLRSNGGSSPRIHQMRVDYGRDTAVESLPAVYRRDEQACERLERLLALSESPLRDLDAMIRDLPRLFDPAAAPGGVPPAWLQWLAAWLDFDLTDRWSDAETRELLAAAYELYGTRGTIEGLRRYLKIYTGVEARITEPAAATRIWALGHTSTLGFTTQLAAASADGAVLDATATLDASHLTRGQRFGAPLFEDVAHRFSVGVYCADLRRPGALADVRAVLDREKPAHTVYSLCLIDARMRVGVQAQVGIDTVVAKGPAPAVLGSVLNDGRLGDAQSPCRSVRQP